jgi:vancomycin permeability regulator SanA
VSATAETSALPRRVQLVVTVCQVGLVSYRFEPSPYPVAMRRRRFVISAVVVLLAVLVSAPWAALRLAAHSHEHQVAGAPDADVVIVLGTQVAAGGREPGDRLTGRLRTAAALVAAGRARVVLVSGDGHGSSGNEPQVMTDYLAAHGVDRSAVIADPYGLDTYDSCARARQVYGVTRALIVTQSYHLARAVTLCRRLGVQAEGVFAACDGCPSATLAREQVRDYFAAAKAVWDMTRDRPPAVTSPPTSAVADALRAR